MQVTDHSNEGLDSNRISLFITLKFFLTFEYLQTWYSDLILRLDTLLIDDSFSNIFLRHNSIVSSFHSFYLLKVYTSLTCINIECTYFIMVGWAKYFFSLNCSASGDRTSSLQRTMTTRYNFCVTLNHAFFYCT